MATVSIVPWQKSYLKIPADEIFCQQVKVHKKREAKQHLFDILLWSSETRLLRLCYQYMQVLHKGDLSTQFHASQGPPNGPQKGTLNVPPFYRSSLRIPDTDRPLMNSWILHDRHCDSQHEQPLHEGEPLEAPNGPTNGLPDRSFIGLPKVLPP